MSALTDNIKKEYDKIKELKQKFNDVVQKDKENNIVNIKQPKSFYKIAECVKEIGKVADSDVEHQEKDSKLEKLYNNLNKYTSEYEEYIQNRETTSLLNIKERFGDNGGNKKMIFEDKNGKIINAITKGEKLINSIPDKKNLSLGAYIKGAVTGDWNNHENEMNCYKALSTTTGKVFIPQELSAQIIDNLRNKLLFDDVPMVMMDTNNLTLAKIKTDPQFEFKKEMDKANVSDMSFEGVELKTHTAYGLIKLSLELFNSASNIGEVIADAMGNALRETIDKSFCYGTGNGIEPEGILTYDDVNKIQTDKIETSKYKSFVQGIGAIRKANGEPTTIGYSSNTETELNLLTDTTGQPLNAPNIVQALEHRTSNQLKDTDILIYNRESIIVGMQHTLSFTVQEDLTDGSVMMRIYCMTDIQPIRNTDITKITIAE